MGPAITLVVAETFEAVRHAAQNLAVRYASDIVPVDPEAVTPELPAKKQSAEGDLKQAMREAALMVDEVSHTAAAMEPHAAIAD